MSPHVKHELLDLDWVGRIAIYECLTLQDLERYNEYLSNMAIMTPQAIMMFSNSRVPKTFGTLFMPGWKNIAIYTGGVLNTPEEAIQASIMIEGCPSCHPVDFKRFG